MMAGCQGICVGESSIAKFLIPVTAAARQSALFLVAFSLGAFGCCASDRLFCQELG